MTTRHLNSPSGNPLNAAEKRFFRICTLLVAVSLLNLSGCKVGPDYVSPELEMPDAWEQAVQKDIQSEGSPLQTYWDEFNDPVLTELIRKASDGNLTLKIAASRIEEARALRGISRSALMPTLTGTADAGLSRSSEETVPNLPSGLDRETDFYSVGGEVAWELDLWGRIRRGIESSTASLEATLDDYRDTLVLYYAEVATTYVDTRTLQERIQFARKNAGTQAETLQLTVDLNEAGLVSNLDVYQARLNLKRTQSTIPSLETLLAKAINRLSVLVGEAPGGLDEMLSEIAPIPTPPDVIGAGLPTDLLRNRPDIRRAERLLAAQTAQIGVAKADLYPALFLPGTLSFEAFDVGNLNGGSLAYSFGPSVRWKLFSGGQIRNQIKAAEARTQQTLHQYEQQVLLALEEVENAMISFANEKDRRGYLSESRMAATNSVQLVKDLYVDGLTHFQNVLDMERSLFVEEDSLTISRGEVVVDAILIFKALGGGWDVPEPFLGPVMDDPETSELLEENNPALASQNSSAQ